MSTPADLYITFVNAFSYTIAVATVDRTIDTSSSDLLFIAATIAVGVTAASIFSSFLEDAKRIAQQQSAQTYEIVRGPASMLQYALSLSQRISIHFMSTVLGKWAIDTTADKSLKFETTVPPVIACVCLLWLLGASTGINQM